MKDDYLYYDDSFIVISDEEGNEYTFEEIDSYAEGNREYVALKPVQRDPDEFLNYDGSLIIMRRSIEDGELFYDDITDPIEKELVFAEFTRRLSNY